MNWKGNEYFLHAHSAPCSQFTYIQINYQTLSQLSMCEKKCIYSTKNDILFTTCYLFSKANLSFTVKTVIRASRILFKFCDMAQTCKFIFMHVTIDWNVERWTLNAFIVQFVHCLNASLLIVDKFILNIYIWVLQFEWEVTVRAPNVQLSTLTIPFKMAQCALNLLFVLPEFKLNGKKYYRFELCTLYCP